ncbi:hypothetical protein [Neorhizobium galegae]|uniref:hypothetical protein n=1 Tax=Neorhizobium galegae TaxID=399 RepID=UPI001272772C|nr:hypothetical protein [Neorhizobium galegae]KAA9386921.1 hypothetical protein F4V88_10785 [Neorhizobium galegae]MCM2499900.1 hypothetical protein [Neorhizobium galegae]
MFFSKFAKAVACLALVVGALQVAIGFGVATETFGPYEQALARYAPGAANSGVVITRGIYAMLFAIGLGTLAEISISLRKVRGTEL